jgi:hypothetical protein
MHRFAENRQPRDGLTAHPSTSYTDFQRFIQLQTDAKMALSTTANIQNIYQQTNFFAK